MNTFNVYLTSKGSKTYFPGNQSSNFTNLLAFPLTNMLNYKVCLSGCVFSPSLPENTVAHICSDIVLGSLYNDNKLPIISVVGRDTTCFTKPIYTRVARDTVSAITISLTDASGQPLTLTNDVFLTLTFKEIKNTI